MALRHKPLSALSLVWQSVMCHMHTPQQAGWLLKQVL